MQMKEVSLDNIADGVAVELFKHELKKIAKNIGDVNTSPTAKRSITLTFSFTPDEAREEVKVIVNAKATLTPVKGYSKTVWCGKRNGEATIYGHDEKQTDLFDQDVTKLAKKTESKNA